MKLSEALRLGEFALPATHLKWFRFDSNDKPCGACAVGRACYAAGFKPEAAVNQLHQTMKDITALTSFVSVTWPWTNRAEYKYPANHTHNQSTLFNPILIAMSDLYEADKWTMTQIADWIETIEPAEITTSNRVTTDVQSGTIPEHVTK
jgi:hypothetical protein